MKNDCLELQSDKKVIVWTLEITMKNHCPESPNDKVWLLSQ